ncbi:MAG: YccF domain-containing protein [Chloroflexi bacterium]|nr:YccF domain-containing protein [Chloroflexota bacterium]
MSFLGNLIWLIFGGFLAAAGYILGGLLLCLTIVGIPFGIQSIKLGLATLAPFGKRIERQDRSDAGYIFLFMDVIWLLLFGWEIAIAHLVGGVALAITIIGFPLALQHFKLVPVALMPFHYRLE